MKDTNLEIVKGKIASAAKIAKRNVEDIRLMAVSKTFEAQQIKPLLLAGHRLFGENRVQEAQQKWPEIKQEFPDVELHLIGPLQSNKTAEAVELFDAIHSIDREKIVNAVAKEMEKQQKKLKLFVQVNTADEPQKAGVSVSQVSQLLSLCKQRELDIEGLMCIPPVNENPGPHFALLAQIAQKEKLNELSMGMSADYETAVELGATYIRVGSALFGSR